MLASIIIYIPPEQSNHPEINIGYRASASTTPCGILCSVCPLWFIQGMHKSNPTVLWLLLCLCNMTRFICVNTFCLCIDQSYVLLHVYVSNPLSRGIGADTTKHQQNKFYFKKVRNCFVYSLFKSCRVWYRVIWGEIRPPPHLHPQAPRKTYHLNNYLFPHMSVPIFLLFYILYLIYCIPYILYVCLYNDKQICH